MLCPFLRETRVKFCRASAYRKMIPEAQQTGLEERCTSSEYSECPAYQREPDPGPGPPCPYLQQSLMQYCAASPVTRFVPYSESALSRCASGGFRYCDLYFELAGLEARPAMVVDGIRMPESLAYSANHMWLDVSEDGLGHIGIDGFFARFLNQVDGVSFLVPQGRCRPAAVVAVRGIDLPVVFPQVVALRSCNLYLRSDPARLTGDPYALGWLFAAQAGEPAAGPTVSGEAARQWMQDEVQRMTEFVQSHGRDGAGERLAADGGVFTGETLRCLSRDDVQLLFHEFFSPALTWRRP
jgi:glycine cleavage system H lipoate-binding protein